MSRGRGRGRGNTSKSAFTGLQVDLQGTSLFPSEPTELFPDISLPVPHKLSEAEERILQFRDDILEELRASAFYLEPPPPPKDIERYSDKYLRNETRRPKLRSVISELAFFPVELHRSLDSSRKNYVQQLPEQDLSVAFEKIERAAQKIDGQEDKENEDEDKDIEKEEAEDDEEDYDQDIIYDDESDDYNENYFDNGEGDDYGEDDGFDDNI